MDEMTSAATEEDGEGESGGVDGDGADEDGVAKLCGVRPDDGGEIGEQLECILEGGFGGGEGAAVR